MFQKLVLQVQEVAPVVLTFKVLPRCYGGGDQHAVRNAVQRRFSLNKKLTSMLKRMPGVRILNPDVRCRCVWHAFYRAYYQCSCPHVSLL